MKTILYTFDYELFLGARPISSGSVNDCLIEPTNWILEKFHEYRVKYAIFFVDTLYLCTLREYLKQNDVIARDYYNIISQLKSILKSGHYIFPHIHPHWLDAQYIPELNQWDLTDYNKYKFSDLSENEKEYVFHRSIDFLNEVVFEKYNMPKSLGYRAGGLIIEPFSDFIPYFKKFNIKFDFSIAKPMGNGKYLKKIGDYYPFSITPFKKNAFGEFFEFTISNYSIGIVDYLYTKYFVANTVEEKDSFNQLCGLVNTISLNVIDKDEKIGIKSEQHQKKKNSSRLGKYMNMLSRKDCDVMSIENMKNYNLASYCKSISIRQYSQFITHPKGLTIENRQAFDKFLSFVKIKYPSVNTNFKELMA